MGGWGGRRQKGIKTKAGVEGERKERKKVKQRREGGKRDQKKKRGGGGKEDDDDDVGLNVLRCRADILGTTKKKKKNPCT